MRKLDRTPRPRYPAGLLSGQQARWCGNLPLERFSLPAEWGGFQSGQMGQTVNLLAKAFGGSNPSPPIRSILQGCPVAP